MVFTIYYRQLQISPFLNPPPPPIKTGLEQHLNPMASVLVLQFSTNWVMKTLHKMLVKRVKQNEDDVNCRHINLNEEVSFNPDQNN